MADLNIQLLDTGENFILVSADTETEINYGQLAVSLVNTNYNNMYNLLTDFLQSNRILRLAMDLQDSLTPDCNIGTINPKIINLIVKSLYKILYEYLGKEYLTTEQASIITLLLMADIRSRLENSKINLDKPELYIPLIYSDNVRAVFSITAPSLYIGITTDTFIKTYLLLLNFIFVDRYYHINFGL